MKHWTDLNENDKKQLLLFPAYISLLASTVEGGIDSPEKQAAIKLTHIKTFASDPELRDFYRAAETNFEKNLDELNSTLPVSKKEREQVIKTEIEKLHSILKKLDGSYAAHLQKSMQSYKNHVSKAHHNILEYFIFPLPIEGITD